jgi:hypothetical protein
LLPGSAAPFYILLLLAILLGAAWERQDCKPGLAVCFAYGSAVCSHVYRRHDDNRHILGRSDKKAQIRFSGWQLFGLRIKVQQQLWLTRFWQLLSFQRA